MAAHGPEDGTATTGPSSGQSDILLEARSLIRGERLQHYGPPHANFKRIADLWSAYLGDALARPISNNDVCAMMILLKQARMADGGYHRDSAMDTAGYAALQEVLAEGINVEEPT